MHDIIIFDMDGTLYDINDVMKSVYSLQVKFLCDKLHQTARKVENLLSYNNIYPAMKPNSRSATEFFSQIGIDRDEWSEYREKNYNVNQIDISKAVSNSTIELFSTIAPLVLVSSNTDRIIRQTLNHIHIDSNLFSNIISSDTDLISGSFAKEKVFEKLIEGKQPISIGDRYQTDILPMLKLGGDGILVEGPHELGKVYHALKSNNLEQIEKYYKGLDYNAVNL